MGRLEELLRFTATGIAGGSGWVVLGLGMYEYAFHLDCGAAAARHVDAFFANPSRQEADRRFEARQPAAAVRG